METDRELTEAAARAIGLKLDWAELHQCHWIACGQGIMIETWEPLYNNAQSFQLAAETGLIVDFASPIGENVKAKFYDIEVSEPVGSDSSAAARRAIVKAVAMMEPRA